MIEDTQYWRTPAKNLELGTDEVHIWKAPLDVPKAVLSSFQSTLSPDEVIRMQRFAFDKDRYRWTVARGLLRTLLGSYTQTDPDTMRNLREV